jgi:hypothetical protein
MERTIRCKDIAIRVFTNMGRNGYLQQMLRKNGCIFFHKTWQNGRSFIFVLVYQITKEMVNLVLKYSGASFEES